MRSYAAGLAAGLGLVALGLGCGDEPSSGSAGTTSPAPTTAPATTSDDLPTTTTVEDPTRRQAIEVVTNVVKAHAEACQAELLGVLSAERVPGVGFWRIRVRVRVPDLTGTATWTVEHGEPVANDEYAADLEHDCTLGT